MTEEMNLPSIATMKTILLMLATSLSGCAVLHHVQLSDIDNRSRFSMQPIDIKVSEIGVDLHEASSIGGAMTRNSHDRDALGNIMAIIQSFQMGPRTGAPVYTEHYADKLIYQLHSQCPSGKLTGLQSIRESREYPVIKGEIVKITGYCLREKGT